MNSSKRKYHSQIEITDLVAEAVSNAPARRNQVLDSEEPLSSLSTEQTESLVNRLTWYPLGIPYPVPQKIES